MTSGTDYAGLYYAYEGGYYLHLWPAGHFVAGIPYFNNDGTFDWETSTERFKPDYQGDYTVSPLAGQPAKFRIDFRYKSGAERVDTLVKYVDGDWDLQKLKMYKLVNRFKEFDGEFTRETDITVPGSEPTPGGVSVGLSVGAYSVLNFTAGNRFHYRNTSYVHTTTSVGGSTGGSTVVDSDFLSSTPVNEGGTYTIEQNFLRLKFDSGAESLEYFRYGPGSLYCFLYWGGRQFVCRSPDCVRRE